MRPAFVADQLTAIACILHRVAEGLGGLERNCRVGLPVKDDGRRITGVYVVEWRARLRIVPPALERTGEGRDRVEQEQRVGFGADGRVLALLFEPVNHPSGGRHVATCGPAAGRDPIGIDT